MLSKQLSAYPKALGMAAAVMAVMGLLPGMPLIPFWFFAGLAGYLAWAVGRQQDTDAADIAVEAAKAAADSGKGEEPASASLRMDELKIEIGYALLPLVNGENGHDRLTEQIKALRKQLAAELGFVMRPCASSTTSSWKPTPTSSASRRWRPATGRCSRTP